MRKINATYWGSISTKVYLFLVAHMHSHTHTTNPSKICMWWCSVAGDCTSAYIIKMTSQTPFLWMNSSAWRKPLLMKKHTDWQTEFKGGKVWGHVSEKEYFSFGNHKL